MNDSLAQLAFLAMLTLAAILFVAFIAAALGHLLGPLLSV